MGAGLIREGFGLRSAFLGCFEPLKVEWGGVGEKEFFVEPLSFYLGQVLSEVGWWTIFAKSGSKF